MNSAAAKMPWIGQSVTRLEDPPLVTGRGEFAGDINFPHQLHMRMVRSAHAHGRIVSLDLSAARALPGVFAVWSAADITDVPPIDFREGSIPALDPYRQPVLANGFVRYVGEPVAAVFAEDPYVAEDAADLVAMQIEELPPQLDAQAAPVEFSPGHSSEAAIIRQGYGDVDAVFRTRQAHRRGRACHRPAFRRAAGDARRHRPLRLSARHSRIARRRQGAASQPGTAVAHARAFRRAASMSTSSMSAAALAFAASFIPRMFWSASPRKNSIAR